MNKLFMLPVVFPSVECTSESARASVSIFKSFNISASYGMSFHIVAPCILNCVGHSFFM